MSIDDDTVEFGDPVLGGTAAPVKSAIEDVDGDGSADLVLHFSVPDLVSAGALDADSEIGMLTGQTAAGNTFSGIDSVRIVPPKK